MKSPVASMTCCSFGRELLLLAPPSFASTVCGRACRRKDVAQQSTTATRAAIEHAKQSSTSTEKLVRTHATTAPEQASQVVTPFAPHPGFAVSTFKASNRESSAPPGGVRADCCSALSTSLSQPNFQREK